MQLKKQMLGIMETSDNSIKDKKIILLQTAKAVACDMGESNKVTIRNLLIVAELYNRIMKESIETGCS